MELTLIKNALIDEKDSIIDRFIEQYFVPLRVVDSIEVDNIEMLYRELISNIIDGDFDNIVNTTNRLVESELKNTIPYIIFINELQSIKRLILERLIKTQSHSSIDILYGLYKELESLASQHYLREYIQQLVVKNNLRINSLNDVYAQNLVGYYKKHIEWLTSLAKSIEVCDISTIPELNHMMCSFGKWLNSDGKSIISNNSKYKNIYDLHRSLHHLAEQIKKCFSTQDKHLHLVLTYLEKCELVSLSLGTELALIDNILYNSQVSKDPLTGALNRQNLELIYNNQLELSFATSKPFAVAMCDLDYFKNINDKYGHIAGDKVLAGFVKIVEGVIRSSDMIIRYGGEEFIIILTAINEEKAYEVLTKIKDEFEAYSLIYNNNEISTTVCMGVNIINPEYYNNILYKNIENVIDMADRKLYEAKNSGRNKIF